jgi:hypothetical protein
MIDVVNPANNFTNTSTYQGIETESAQSLFGRYDLVLPNQAAINAPGLQLVPNTTTVFGNNGTTARNTASNLATNTSLNQFSNHQELLNDLYNVSDHLPVLADYNLVGVTPLWLAWTGGTGNWSAANKWHAGLVPNLAATEARIDTTISTAAASVTLDQNATAKDLLLGANATLTIPAGRTLTLAGPTPSTLAGTLTAAGTFSAAANVTNSGTLTIAGQQWTPGVTLSNTGSLTLNADAGYPASANLNLSSSAGTVTFNASQHLASLSLSGTAHATLPHAATATTLMTNALTLSGVATLDLADNTLTLRYTNSSPADLFRSFLFTAAVFSSSATTLTALAYTDTSTSITSSLALLGDINLDGKVNADDYTTLDRAFAKHLADPHWTDGDFNYDGQITPADYALIDQTFLSTQSPAFAPEFLAQRESQFGSAYVSQLLTSIPEPALPLSSILYSLSSLLLPRRRRP